LDEAKLGEKKINIRDAIGPDVLDGAIEIAQNIMEQYPPDQYHYIGVGRSPAAITAYMKAQGHDASNLPLTKFRHGAKIPHQNSTPPLDLDKEAEYMKHFDEFLPKPKALGKKNIVTLDYTPNGGSLVAAYNYIHRYYTGQQKERPTEKAFWANNNNRLSTLWDWDEETGPGLQKLQLAAAGITSKENVPEILKVMKTNEAEDQEGESDSSESEENEDLGPIARLRGGNYTVHSPQTSKGSAFIGELDRENLKGYSEFGTYEKGQTKSKPNDKYQQLIDYFKDSPH
jgi:hypothetical protein